MYKAQIDTLASMLQNADHEAADRCDAMYAAKFRSAEPKTVGAVFGAGDDAMDAFYNEFDCDFDESLQIVYLCNYKGEGEGWALWEDCKALPVFKSKRDSAAFFGA